MLSFSPSVMDAFTADAFSRFVLRTRTLLRQLAPSDVARFDDPLLDLFIRESAKDSAEHGIRSERGIAKWTLLRIIAGPSFHELPAVAVLFADTDDREWALRLLFDRLGDMARSRGG